MAESSSPLKSPASDPSQDDAAHLFNLASNPTRLRILVSLNDGARTIDQLSEGLGKDRRLINQYVNSLAQANLVRSTRQGRRRVYLPTDSGQRLVQAAGIVSGATATPQPVVHAGREPPPKDPLRPSPAEQGDALTHFVDRLKALAEPVRLRLLNLLAGRHEVCVCHLHEAMELPQSTVSRHLTILRRAGLIVGRRHGTWVYYRLAHPAPDLNRLMAAYFDQDLLHCSGLAKDRRRLEGLIPCADRREPRG